MRFVICGSMVNDQEIQAFRDRLLKRYGKSQAVIPFDVPYNMTHEPVKKAANRHYYFKAIDEADIIIVYTKNHVGIGTSLEIGYALCLGKAIRFTHQPPEGQQGDELRGMLADGSATMLPKQLIGDLGKRTKPYPEHVLSNLRDPGYEGERVTIKRESDGSYKEIE